MLVDQIELERRFLDSYEIPNNVIYTVQQPLVTVRTSAYLHGSYIKQCIEGVLMQKTTFQIEYIIGEDYSTDSTRNIVFDYAKRYPDLIRVITADYNVGMKANGLRCIKHSRGKYMAMCEGDDYWTDPFKLQKQVDFLEGHPEYSACFTNGYFFNEIDKTRRIYCQNMQEGDVNISDIINIGGYIYPTASLVYKMNKVDLEMNNKVHGLPGDSLLIFSLAMNGKIYFMDQITCVYRRWSGGIHSGIAKDKVELNKIRINALTGYQKLDTITGGKYRKFFEQKISRISLAIIKNPNEPFKCKYFKYLKLKEKLHLVTWWLSKPLNSIKGKIKQIIKHNLL